jgi:hypothetical protein
MTSIIENSGEFKIAEDLRCFLENLSGFFRFRFDLYFDVYSEVKSDVYSEV